jgi:mono/diheme cytochrome c family protein
MRTKLILVILAAGLAGGLAGGATWVAARRQTAAPQQAEATSAPTTNSSAPPGGASGNPRATSPAVARAQNDAGDRIEGEKRFRANCSRCHQTPHKFPPRAMATIVRHMRVRATLTDEDARLILKYMTQ